MKQFIEKIILEAGKEALRISGGAISIKVKDRDSNLVTNADLASEKILVNAIKNSYPQHDIISEESSDHPIGDNWTWIIDPLDGTRNFSRHTPFWGILVGLSHYGKMEYGAMYFPELGSLYFAEKGKGATKNHIELNTFSRAIKFTSSLGCLAIDANKTVEMNLLNNIAKYMPGSSIWITALNCGSLAAAFVADGSRDWCLASYAGKIWDYAVPIFILQEANITVTTLKGVAWSLSDKDYIAAPAHIHPELLNLVNASLASQLDVT